MSMNENVQIKELSETVAENISTINYNLNLIVIIVGLLITVFFFILYFTRLKSKQLLNYVPNVWTSMGILGTFIAIIVSLNNGGTRTLSDVDTLVKNIIPAFTTSIIGIIGALICSIVTKIIYAIEEKKEEQIYAATVGDNISPELMLDRINRSIEKLITIASCQESNIKLFLDNYMLQLDTFYTKIYESNKVQVQTLSDEYVSNVANILKGTNEEINKRIDSLLLSHSESIQIYLNTEKEKLDEVADDIKSFLEGVPRSVNEMKTEMINALRNAIIEKYNLLLDGNEAFTNKLLDRVRTFESELTKVTNENCTDILNDTKLEIQKIITLLENSLNSQTTLIENVTSSLSPDISNLIISVNKSIRNYEAMVKQMDKFIPILQKHVKHSENNISIAEQNSVKLTEVLSTLEEVVKKNQQLRYELTQWKRVHKKVKVNEKNGTKECPNCDTENPMDANFCRKCNYGFWDCEKIS